MENKHEYDLLNIQVTIIRDHKDVKPLNNSFMSSVRFCTGTYAREGDDSFDLTGVPAVGVNIASISY